MANQMGLHVGCLLLVVAVALLKGAAADNYTVGDGLGWSIPPLGSVAYKTWADKKSFQIGDTIVFNWTGSHTVAEVSEANYGNCTKSNPLALYDSSPVPITLTSNLTRYFICTVDDHCSGLGQKVTIKIGGDGDRWWEGNSASSPTLNIAALLFCSAIAAFFLSF
ncbi:hypothetical protein ACE6H2_025542 [Prunus campanulata]